MIKKCLSCYSPCLMPTSSITVIQLYKTIKRKDKNRQGWTGRQCCWDISTIQDDLQIQCDPYQTPRSFFSETEKSILKFIQNFRRLQIAKTILKENKTRGLIFSDFKTYYKVTSNQKAWYWHKDRHLEQWNRIDSPEINPHIYGQRILTRVSRPFNGERTVFSANGAGKTE